jgi:hypothetical protein
MNNYQNLKKRIDALVDGHVPTAVLLQIDNNTSRFSGLDMDIVLTYTDADDMNQQLKEMKLPKNLILIHFLEYGLGSAIAMDNENFIK